MFNLSTIKIALGFSMLWAMASSVRGANASNKARMNITQAYDATIAALDQIQIKDVQFFSAAQKKKELKILLERGAALQLAAARFLEMLHALATQCGLGRKMMQEVEEGLVEFLSGKLSQEEQLVKAKGFVDKVSLITIDDNQWKIKLSWLYIMERSLKFYYFFKVVQPIQEENLNEEWKVVNTAEVYLKAMEALKETKKAAGRLFSAVQEKNEEKILEKAKAFHIYACRLSQLLHTIAIQCQLCADPTIKEQAVLTQLLSGNLTHEELLTGIEALVENRKQKLDHDE